MMKLIVSICEGGRVDVDHEGSSSLTFSSLPFSFIVLPSSTLPHFDIYLAFVSVIVSLPAFFFFYRSSIRLVHYCALTFDNFESTLSTVALPSPFLAYAEESLSISFLLPLAISLESPYNCCCSISFSELLSLYLRFSKLLAG